MVGRLNAVRQIGAAFIEGDDTGETGEFVQPMGEVRFLPISLNI
jgi:hypothetical protein